MNTAKPTPLPNAVRGSPQDFANGFGVVPLLGSSCFDEPDELDLNSIESRENVLSHGGYFCLLR